MRITYYTHSPVEYKSRHIQIGSKLIGLRLLEFSIDNEAELHTLLSEEGIKWAKKHLRFSLFQKVSPPEKESNWGSDWVDDGV